MLLSGFCGAVAWGFGRRRRVAVLLLVVGATKGCFDWVVFFKKKLPAAAGKGGGFRGWRPKSLKLALSGGTAAAKRHGQALSATAAAKQHGRR